MRLTSGAHLLLALASLSFSAPADAPPADPIRIPTAPDIPQPMPPKPPAPRPSVMRLTPDLWYVIDSDIPLMVLASPDGIVKLTEEAGPQKLKGRFIDEPLKTQTKTFRGKEVWTVEPIRSGRVELIIIPCGPDFTLPRDIRRVTLDVDDGSGPQPPPVPPEPKPPEPVKSFRVVFVVESGALLTAAENSVVYGKAVEDYLTAACTGGRAGWNRLDKDNAGADLDPTMRALWQAVRPKVTATPCVAVAVNEQVDIIPLAATPAAMVETLKKYAGGK